MNERYIYIFVYAKAIYFFHQFIDRWNWLLNELALLAKLLELNEIQCIYLELIGEKKSSSAYIYKAKPQSNKTNIFFSVYNCRIAYMNGVLITFPKCQIRSQEAHSLFFGGNFHSHTQNIIFGCSNVCWRNSSVYSSLFLVEVLWKSNGLNLPNYG